MPTPSSKARVERTGETLRFAGGLTREVVAPLWPQAVRLLDGVRTIDLTEVSRVDSAGIALIAELGARLPAAVAIEGEPEGFRALCAAYRLTSSLTFA